MFDWIFAFFHLFLFLGLIGYAVYSLAIGNTTRFFILSGGLILYYLLVLHKGVRSEIKRRRGQNTERKS
jgi:hypothetical protein